MSGPVSERPAGTPKVLDYIVRVGEPVTRAEIRKRFAHTSSRLLQEILTWLLEADEITVETDVDPELDTFRRAGSKGGRRPTLSPQQKTFREELDELLDQQEAWTRQEIAAALPHRPLTYIDPCLSVEKKARRLVVVEIDGHNAYCRPETAAKYDTNTPSAAKAASPAEKTAEASPAGDTDQQNSSLASKPLEEGNAEMIPEEPAVAPAGAETEEESPTMTKSASEANARQIGGQHYKKHAIEPWDYIAQNELGYLEGNVIKYVTRHRDKGGVADLEKAEHYLQKLLELERERAQQ